MALLKRAAGAGLALGLAAGVLVGVHFLARFVRPHHGLRPNFVGPFAGTRASAIGPQHGMGASAEGLRHAMAAEFLAARFQPRSVVIDRIVDGSPVFGPAAAPPAREVARQSPRPCEELADLEFKVARHRTGPVPLLPGLVRVQSGPVPCRRCDAPAGASICPASAPPKSEPSTAPPNSNAVPFAELTTDLAAPAGLDSTTPPRPLPQAIQAVPLPIGSRDQVEADQASRLPGPPISTLAPGTAPPRRSAEGKSPGRRIIDKELPDSSTEERDLWHETLKDLPPNELRELLQLRKEIGRSPWPTSEPAPAPSQPSLLVPDPRALEPDLLPDPAGDAVATPDSSDPHAVVRQSLAAIRQARLVVVNNIANANTPGYKREIPCFESKTEPTAATGPQAYRHASLASAGGKKCRSGCCLSPVSLDTKQGELRQTEEALDLAIIGPGFFQIQDPSDPLGTCYTRHGRFQIDGDGRLIIRLQNKAWPLSPNVKIPAGATQITIEANGTVRVLEPPALEPRQVGRIVLARFADARNLAGAGGIIYRQGEAVQAPAVGPPDSEGRGKLQQAFLEESNVDVKEEIAELAHLAQEQQMLERVAAILQIDLPETSGHPGDLPRYAPGLFSPAAREERR